MNKEQSAMDKVCDLFDIGETMQLKKYIKENKIKIRTTKDETGHGHSAMVDANGDGNTVDTVGDAAEEHEHEIKQWMVQLDNGHVHNLES